MVAWQERRLLESRHEQAARIQGQLQVQRAVEAWISAVEFKNGVVEAHARRVGSRIDDGASDHGVVYTEDVLGVH
jgi:hypothetical protein